MTIKQSAVVYAIVNFILACAGFFVIYYLFLFKISTLLGKSDLSSGTAVLIVSLATIIVLLAAALLAIYVAFALSIGFVDSVSGTYSSVEICNGRKLFRTQIRKVFFLGNEFTIGGKRVVFFIAGVTPHICQVDSFHVDQAS